MVAGEQPSNTLNGLTDTKIKYEKLICNKYSSNYGTTGTDSIQYTLPSEAYQPLALIIKQKETLGTFCDFDHLLDGPAPQLEFN